MLDELDYERWVACEYRPAGGTLAGLGWARPHGIDPGARTAGAVTGITLPRATRRRHSEDGLNPSAVGTVEAVAVPGRPPARPEVPQTPALADMRQILVTNDDGIEAEGLRALADALAALGRVTVVAPAEQSSAVGHGLTLRRPLELREAAPGWHSVDGTPADCVNIAASEVLGGAPDLVVSGINDGLNIGDDVTYSGTVAGALEGVLLGAPAIAVSLQRSQRMDYAGGGYIARQLAEAVLFEGLPAPHAAERQHPAHDSPRHPHHGAGEPAPDVRHDRLRRGGTNVGPHRLRAARLGAERAVRPRGHSGRLGLRHAAASRLDQPRRPRRRRISRRIGRG